MTKRDYHKSQLQQPTQTFSRLRTPTKQQYSMLESYIPVTNIFTERLRSRQKLGVLCYYVPALEGVLE